MPMFLQLILLLVGVAILVKGADWFTDGAISIAHRFHVPEIVIGVTLVSLCTTLPELSVSFLAACLGEVDVSVGNACLLYTSDAADE